jgi:hypothetical protein
MKGIATLQGDLFVCLFVYSCLSNFAAIRRLSPLPRWQGCKFRPMFGTQGLWAGRDLYHATPTETRDLGLYGLIQKTGTHVPQWDSNLRRKILAPDALTTAPRRRLLSKGNFILAKEQKIRRKFLKSSPEPRGQFLPGLVQIILGGRECKFVQITRISPLQGGDSKRVKIHWNLKKKFFSRTSEPNSIKLGTIIFESSEFKFVQKRDRPSSKGG